MAKLLHNLLCTVSRRYRAAHCNHVDELPQHIQRRLREECREMDPRSWNDSDEFFRDLNAELDEEDRSGDGAFSFRKTAAVFA